MSHPLRVLIVDDDRNMLRTLSDILAASGFIVKTAVSAADGLQTLETGPCDVVVTDIRMEGMNGVEFQRVIVSKNPAARVILITAYADHDLIKKGREQGALAFLDKPLEIPLLLAILKAVESGAPPPDGPARDRFFPDET